jgi:hypothetical protein
MVIDFFPERLIPFSTIRLAARLWHYLLESWNYIGQAFVCCRSRLDSMPPVFTADGELDCYDLLLEICEEAEEITHLSKVLYHRFDASEQQRTPARPIALARHRDALDGPFRRVGEGTRRIERASWRLAARHPHPNARVAIILPTANWRLLETAVESVIRNSIYHNYGILVIDNSVDERVGQVFSKSLTHGLSLAGSTSAIRRSISASCAIKGWPAQALTLLCSSTMTSP